MTPQIARDTSDGKTIFRLPGTQMEVEVILASEPTTDAPLIYTIRMRYPRIIHSEVMTHRVFGRNARSSRAVPIKRMICEVRDNPFVPWHWGKNQKGMQADEEHNARIGFNGESNAFTREEYWVHAADHAVHFAEAFMNAGYHKQVVNRLLEPFMYIDVLITATEWENFLWLRDHKDAEPHLQDLARMTRQAMDLAVLQLLEPGQWHLPYIGEADWEEGTRRHSSFLRQVSAARCARISYAPFDGDASYERELERYNMLVTSDRVHASPLEHQATPNTWVCDETEEMGGRWACPDLSGNLSLGWIQARKLVPNEAVT